MESIEGRYERGKQLRGQVPRSSHDTVTRPSDVDSVDILLAQEEGRLESLIPVRHQRMGESPYSFYRAGARLMAVDLARSPTTNLIVQACGDAHLANFGFYGSPERRLVFDINDFDETLPASFEWDLKRLVASFVIASADNGIDPADREAIAMHCTRAYRDAMADFASRGLLEVWYAHFDAEELLKSLQASGTSKDVKRAEAFTDKARRQGSRKVLEKLTERVDGRIRIISDPPFVIPIRDLDTPGIPGDQVEEIVRGTLESYTETMPDHLAALLARFDVLDVALKVVGVGSVGTRCFIVLMQGRDEGDPLFLQVKEAGRSVLEDPFPPSVYDHQGRRVVEGQRAMQTHSDLFLGWTTGAGADAFQFYVRQLKDMKASAPIEDYGPRRMTKYAGLCAWTLAQCHARTGDPVALSGYMGSGDVFAEAITGFAVAYAAQNEADYTDFAKRAGFAGATA